MTAQHPDDPRAPYPGAAAGDGVQDDRPAVPPRPDQQTWPPQSSAVQPYVQQPYVQQPYVQQPYGQPPGPYGYGPYGHPPYAVAAKNPGLSLLASFFVPGLGSMINGEVGKGIGILLGYLVSAVLTVVIVGFVGLLGFWVWGMVDGYQGARAWNARHGIVS